jgi:hypothetical protein
MLCNEDTRRQLSRLKWKLGGSPELTDLCEEIEVRLIHLEGQIQSPVYQRCFLIRGGPGSGKTQFVFQLLDGGMVSGSYIPVLIRPPKGRKEDLKLLLLHEMRQVSRYELWRTLEDVNRFLERHGVRILLMFDGLQRWADTIPDFVKQLKSLIAEHSEWHSLYWLVTARDRSLLPFGGGWRFWLEYGFRGPDESWQRALEPIPTTDDERHKAWLEQMEQVEISRTGVSISVGGYHLTT